LLYKRIKTLLAISGMEAKIMNPRVSRLRAKSLSASPSMTAERALLMTEFYRSAGLNSAPMQRALAFKHLMENMSIYIGEGELIVGERGPKPKASCTYPEICCHSLSDLDKLNSRPKTSYSVDPAERDIYEQEIIPFWQGRTLREKLFAEMTPAWRDCFEAGLFTEFMEQRAPGHTTLDSKVFRFGFKDHIKRIDAALKRLDLQNDPAAYAKSQQLRAMRITCRAIISFGKRHAKLAAHMAKDEQDPARKAELELIARVCERVPANAPQNFHEALQHYWFIHLGIITELNPWDAINPGRLDQHLLPFYEKGLVESGLTRESAKELLQCLWIKFNNQPAPPKVGVTAEESGTYTDFANINSGGLTPEGTDGVNEVTYLVLEVIDEMRLLQPSSNIQLSRKNPDKFLKAALKIVRKGWGQPSIFNHDMVIQELLRQGKDMVDAREGGTSGCVESGAFGKEAYILTGYFNLPKVLEITLNNGKDPISSKQLGPKTGGPGSLKSFDELMSAFKKQMRHFIDIKVRGNLVIEQLYANHLPVPFLSVLIDDCIQKGLDYNAGGARYNTSYIQGVGIGTITDSLSAIKTHVFDKNALTLSQLVKALNKNFKGEDKLKARLINKTPRYGNDDDAADGIMRTVFRAYHDEVAGRPNGKGGVFRINMLPTTCHVYFGSVMGASPDGRLAGKPVSEGISPVQGADRNGPTAVLKSAAKMDHVMTGGTLLNQKFTPALLQGERGLNNLTDLVRTYFKMDGHHIQFNVVQADILKEAQAAPDDYRDLIVRVAGYSDYFCDLSKELQDEIIERTEHKEFG
jgi:pyruvate formate-lyase/glycerol dehydratase family glycyl radical enzyme